MQHPKDIMDAHTLIKQKEEEKNSATVIYPLSL
jgi:hypothetical protein